MSACTDTDEACETLLLFLICVVEAIAAGKDTEEVLRRAPAALLAVLAPLYEQEIKAGTASSTGIQEPMLVTNAPKVGARLPILIFRGIL